ncbi:FtsK/SpoIIIE domain-containing protein (plasmid) [Bacillus cereus]|nr:FtsK/SpoIIIE domain-containing protein [Bacillus cereus]
MLFEIASSAVVSGAILYAKMYQSGVTNDATKIQRICSVCGLKKNNETIQLIRRTRHKWGTEYVYRIPLGLGFYEFEQKKRNLEDGLNHRRKIFDFKLLDFKSLRLRKDILKQIRNIVLNKKTVRKEIELFYDGFLKIRVYEKGIPEFVQFEESILNQCKGWQIPLGFTRDKMIKHDFEQIPHFIVGGTTRYGKSVFLKNVITSLIYRKSDEVKFTLIDLKGGLAFNRFKDVKQVESVAKNAYEALAVLSGIRNQLNSRMDSFLEKGYEDVKESNLAERHFIIIDEAAEIASTGVPDKEEKKIRIECERIISDIARRGAGVGYRLIFCTQYATSDVLPRQVKQNTDARLCFKLQTEIASQVVLGEGNTEAAHLPFIKGRAVYMTDKQQIVQTPFIDNKQIDNIIKPHINIRARKEHEDAKVSNEGTTLRKHTLQLEEIGIFD